MMVKFLVSGLLSAAVGIAGAAEPATPHSQLIGKAGAQAPTKGPVEYFTGEVDVGPLLAAGGSSRFSAAQVTFPAGARSAWHTHPAGQYLVVTAGSGWTQEWGGKPVAIRAGDVVWCPPGVKHWHGATRTTGMSHVAMSGALDGKNVDWMEKVSDAQYPQ